MQSSASRRAFSALASKIHPQLPLSPRESQQLLSLLTSSFRAHLDREHPVAVPDSNSTARHKAQNTLATQDASSAPTRSSRASAAQHIDSILANPLFARKPQRRASESAAIHVLKDPLSWFLDQIATGAATLPKAAMCLDLLQRTAGETLPQNSRRTEHQVKPGSVIAEWLRSSGLETSKEFLAPSNKVGARLIPLLLAEGDQVPLWRWLTQSPAARTEETGLEVSQVHAFRTQLLKTMVSKAPSRDDALTIFLRAYQLVQAGECDLTHKILQPAGSVLVEDIIARPELSSTPELYDSFLASTYRWLGRWFRAIQSILWLYHPTKPTARPGLSFIIDPEGAAFHLPSVNWSRQRILVQLCLGIARRLLMEEDYANAQIAMEFTKEHFSEIVLSKMPTDRHPTSRKKAQIEKKNLELLDRLLPT